MLTLSFPRFLQIKFALYPIIITRVHGNHVSSGTKELRCIVFLHTCSLSSSHTHTQANGSPDNWAQLAWSEWNEHQKHPANCYINLFWQSPPITSAFVISSEELPSVGLGFEGNLSFPVLFTFSLFWEEGRERMEIRMVKTSKGACDIYVHNWSTCGYFWFHAQIGLWWILASLCTTGHWVTLRRLILSSVKRSVSRWIQNIML